MAFWIDASYMRAMKTLLFLAALTASAPAQDDDLYWADVLTSDPELQQSCRKWVAPQPEPEDTYAAVHCGRVAQEFLIYYSGRFTYEEVTHDAMECAVKIILSHPDRHEPAEQVMDAEFDRACQPALM